MSMWDSEPRLREFFGGLLERAAALPGVTMAGAVSGRPFGGGTSAGSFAFVEDPQTQDEAGWSLEQTATPGYFEALRIPLERGRFFGPQDTALGERVLIVNERFARQYFPDRDPIGQFVWDDNVRHTIVGVVGDVKHATLQETVERKRYRAFAQDVDVRLDVVLRTDGDPLALAAALRHVVQDAEPLAIVAETTTMDGLIAAATALPRFRTLMLGLLAAMAMGLAAVGIYGVVAFTVASRTREIGVRMSLGARGTDVLRDVLGSGLKLIVPGLMLGTAAALAASSALEAYLFEIPPHDPSTFAGAAAAVGVVALTATLVPARRASRVDPLVALRQE
jgi:putative ABC transport system permease protein